MHGVRERASSRFAHRSPPVGDCFIGHQFEFAGKKRIRQVTRAKLDSDRALASVIRPLCSEKQLMFTAQSSPSERNHCLASVTSISFRAPAIRLQTVSAPSPLRPQSPSVTRMPKPSLLIRCESPDRGGAVQTLGAVRIVKRCLSHSATLRRGSRRVAIKGCKGSAFKMI